MNMNWKLNNRGLILGLFLVSVLSSCKNEHSEPSHENHIQHESDYICPMRCEGDKTYQQPGNCPVCKMKLQLVEIVIVQTLSPNKQVLSRQATVKLQSESEAQTVEANGYIDYDRYQSQNVAAWFGGRIENLSVKFNFRFVRKGEKILEIYSPELNTIQEQHLFILKTETDLTLIDQSRGKLQLLGITSQQISELERKETFAQTITVFSPTSGYILFNRDISNSTSSKASPLPTLSGMNMTAISSSNQTSGSAGIQIREGMYVNKGETLFSIVDLRTVWAIIYVPSEYHSSIQPNKQINVTSELFPEKSLVGKIILLEQIFEENQQRFIRVRVELPSPNAALKINSLVTAIFPVASKQGFRIPASAVYRTGMNSFVWVKTGITKNGTGIFELRKVTIGTVSNGMTSIINGLEPDDEIALHAGVLTDSETFLNEN